MLKFPNINFAEVENNSSTMETEITDTTENTNENELPLKCENIKEYSFFDETESYQNEIRTAIEELSKICNEHKVPMFCSVNYSHTKELGSYFATAGVFHGSRTPMQYRMFADIINDESGAAANACAIALAVFHEEIDKKSNNSNINNQENN